MAFYTELVLGAFGCRKRNKSLDPLTERATKQVMDDLGPEPMTGDPPSCKLASAKRSWGR